MSRYSYSRLPEGADYIRLLRLMPHENERTERTKLRCELFKYPLQDLHRGTHLYEALSYTWGGEEKPCSILIEGQELDVTTNLHAALLRLRHRSLARILWVDAICINQDDFKERGQQVQLMAMIYSKAYCVIVWLGEMADDVKGALEYIQYAADEEFIHGSDKNSEETGVLNLLQRQWFQRVWVLQEVAAARHVIVVCGSTEIDGYAFCLGLHAMRQSQQLSYAAFPVLHSLPSLTDLIERASLRPKHITSSQETYSLQIRSLAELVDMFHTRQASDSRDKVYALLGMSSDNPSETGIQPDYENPWEDLVQRLVKFILGQDTLVETSSQRLLIKIKGCILGQVSLVRSDKKQSVTITSTNTDWSSEEWSLQASAKVVRKGDVVCLLKGASKPTIMRLCGKYFAVVVIAATPLKGSGTSAQPELSKSTKHFSRDFLLVWDWEDHLEDSQDEESMENWLNNIQAHKGSKAELGDHMDKATSIWNVALVLGDLKNYGKAKKKLREAIECYEMANGKQQIYTMKSQYGLTPLSWVAGNGYDPAVKRLLAKDGIDPDLQDSLYSRTPLSWAAEGGHEAVAKLLLETGKVEIDAKDSIGRTPLSWAAQGGHEAVAKLLLETGKVEIDSRDCNSWTPLLWATQGGHEAIFKLLLETGKVEIDAKDSIGRTALQAAAGGGHLAIVERLLQEKADVNAAAGHNGGRTALQAAAGGGHLAVVERLLQEKAYVNAAAGYYGGRTALQAAAGGGHLAVVERLLQEKADVNAAAGYSGGRTALQAAAGGGHLAVVERLLQEKADVNAAAGYSGGRTALQAAAEGGRLAVVERLLQEKADVNAAAARHDGGRTALQAAAEGGHLAVVERLLQEKANVNEAAAYDGGRTALQAAAERGHLAVVERLLQEKADVNAAAARHNGGRTALQAAAEGGHLAIVERLLQKKANVNAAAAYDGGRTALQAAAEGGHLAVVERLLQEKADVNATAAVGYYGRRTALQAAAEGGYLAIVNLLRDAGAI